jgi:isopentenyl diphosphate isomerase/L-lactate dehydrogenase-like FMN-dependent dehydrogenase
MVKQLGENRGNPEIITREYFDSLLFEMRHLDAVTPSTQIELFGELFQTPVMFAALSHLNKAGKDTSVQAARAIASIGGVMFYGMAEEDEMEQIYATGARTISIIKPYADPEIVYRKIKHAEAHGALAVGMDVDHQFGSKGNVGQVIGVPMKPYTTQEIGQLVRATDLPFIVKGVLSETDARKCLEAGVGGVVVSHHHGMVDYAVPPLQVLPQIANVIRHRIPIFVDCGVASGLDVFKAVALGATGACVGRAAMPPLNEGGEEALRNLFNSYTEELAWAMCVTNTHNLFNVDPSILWHKDT